MKRLWHTYWMNYWYGLTMLTTNFYQRDVLRARGDWHREQM